MQWKGITKDINYPPQTLSIDSSTNKLLLYNNFTKINGTKYYGCALWNGITFDSLWTYSTSSVISQIIKYKGEYYANAYDRILKKAGPYTWLPVTTTFTFGQVQGMCIYNNELVIYGEFIKVNNVAASSIAKFDGANWSQMDTLHFAGGTIFTAAEHNGNLYIGGNMVAKNGWCDNLGMFDGTHFVNVSNNAMAGGNSGVGEIINYKNNLYLKGNFHKTKGNPASGFVKWDGVKWDTLGGGFTNQMDGITDMTVYHNELYCIGRFQTIAGINSNHMFKFDGNTIFGGNVCDFQLLNLWMGIESYNDTLYVCGGFEKICNDSARYIAKWMGNSSSFTNSVQVVGIKENNQISKKFIVYPNPVSNILHIETSLEEIENSEIEIINYLGQVVQKLPYAKTIDVSALSEGYYQIKVSSINNTGYRTPFIKQ